MTRGIAFTVAAAAVIGAVMAIDSRLEDVAARLDELVLTVHEAIRLNTVTRGA